MFNLKNKKSLSILKFHLKDNMQFILCFLIFALLIFGITLIYYSFKVNTDNAKTIANSELNLNEVKHLPVPYSSICNLVFFGPSFMTLSIAISLFFITKIYSSEIKNGTISFWLSTNNRTSIYVSKWYSIQLISIIIFFPNILMVCLFSFQASDYWNIKLVILQGFAFLITIILFNSFLILLNLLLVEKTQLFGLFVALLIFWLLGTGITNEIYYLNPEQWSFLAFNKYFSLQLFMPMVLHYSQVRDESLWFNGVEQFLYKVTPTSVLEILLKIFLVQPILNLLFILLGKRKFKKLQFLN